MGTSLSFLRLHCVVIDLVSSYKHHSLLSGCMTSQGGVASLNFDAAELKIFYDNLGSPSNPNLQYERFETYH